jgi:anti-sigma-K factor RskA
MPDDERLLDLLAERATQGLSEDAERELDDRLTPHEGIGADELALAATAADRAFELLRRKEDAPPLPASIKAAVLEQAADAIPAAPPVTLPRARRRFIDGPWPGWLAAAAVLVAALLLYPDEPTVPPPPTVAAQRAALLDEAGTVQVAWATPEDPAYAAVRGDVVWSAEQQRGFMRLEGLPANDPMLAQYQVWIVDPRRDERPVDGGVFDVSGTGEAIIPIDAKLDILEPAAFAITLEQPGGVVVSDGPLLVVAAVTG